MNTTDGVKSNNLKGRVLSCPAMGKTTSFQLVDEFGSGGPYAGLAYEVVDTHGLKYSGLLDSTGTGEVLNHCAGPLALSFTETYRGEVDLYKLLIIRDHYPLKITELQVRAEQTHCINKDGSRSSTKPIMDRGQFVYCQVEVRHLVEHVSHLPPEVKSHFPLNVADRRLMGKFGARGVCMSPECHTVLEVRPLRALRPLLSTGSEFCALNLYQLALMATLSYCPFGQAPDEQPVTTPGVSFKQEPSMGNWFGDKLATFTETWQVNPEQTQAYYPLYEDVPYSQRLEIVPFDPVLYSANDPSLGLDQENPANIHFLDDTKEGVEGTDTQAFVTHNDQVILIAVRGTSAGADFLRDADALQVPFVEGEGQVHRGFYEAAHVVSTFASKYLDKFYAGQKVLVCGHSLGGAIALILSQMLRCRKGFDYDVLLYTYGAPRAADTTFVNAAQSLVHHRTVNHNDPIPSVPATWMNTKFAVYGSGVVLTFVNVPVGLSVFATGLANLTGEPYQHHGTLRHFMPVEFDQGLVSHLLWTPVCDTVIQHAVIRAALGQQDGLPQRESFVRQLFSMDHHYMVDSYIPGCWAALRRHKEALDGNGSLVTKREFDFVDEVFEQITQQLRVEYRKEMTLPDKKVQGRESNKVLLVREVDKITATRERLKRLKFTVPSPADVYGRCAMRPEQLAHSLQRWLAHAENTRPEQLAMAPQALEVRVRIASLDDPLTDHIVGACYTGDILDLG